MRPLVISLVAIAGLGGCMTTTGGVSTGSGTGMTLSHGVGYVRDVCIAAGNRFANLQQVMKAKGFAPVPPSTYGLHAQPGGKPPGTSVVIFAENVYPGASAAPTCIVAFDSSAGRSDATLAQAIAAEPSLQLELDHGVFKDYRLVGTDLVIRPRAYAGRVRLESYWLPRRQ